MKTHAASPHPLALPHAHRWSRGRWIRYVRDRFLLLPLGAIIALVWANTAAESYFRFSHALAFGVNEIGMAVFLALVAQEVREALMPGGALHTWRRWALCLIAAAGGMLGAAGVYLLYVGLHYEAVLSQAWPVACAIDVAAAYYVLKLIRIRRGALPFILLLALATDAVGLLVVALRSQGGVEIPPAGALLILSALGIAWLLRARKVRVFWPYLIVCGALSWWGLYLAGVHPALALVPIVPFLPWEPRSLDLFAEPRDDDAVHHAEHEWNGVAQVVLFFFGLVNAGVILTGDGTGTRALLAAAVVGRPLGILAAVGLAVAAGFHLPRRLGWRELIVVALATSSGFTFALFFATGILPTGPVLAEIKLGALATVAAALAAMGSAWALGVGRFARRDRQER
jgi:NhaA family Na+:H+ antiporter